MPDDAAGIELPGTVLSYAEPPVPLSYDAATMDGAAGDAAGDAGDPVKPAGSVPAQANNDAAIAVALASDEANANNANKAHNAAAKRPATCRGLCWMLFMIVAFVGFCLAIAALLTTASMSYEGIGSVYFANADVRFAGVSTTGVVSLCTRECWDVCRKYKQTRRCEKHCNAVFGTRNCTTVEAEVAGCGDDLLSAAQTGRRLGLGFGVPVVLAVAALLVGVIWLKKKRQPQDRQFAGLVLFVGHIVVLSFAAVGAWLTWGTQQGVLSLPVCTSITAFLSVPSGTTYDALGFYAYTTRDFDRLGAAIVATLGSVGIAVLLLLELRAGRRRQ